MSDFSDINGVEPKDLKNIYSIYPNLGPEIDHGAFRVSDYPNINVLEIITDSKRFEREVQQLERFKLSSTDSEMGSMFQHYNDVESVYGILEICEVINLPGHKMSIPERSSISGKTIYRMKDGSLKVSHFVGDLYYDLEDCKKVAIKGMKSVFEYADQKLQKITKQLQDDKKDWEKVFLEYPHLIV